eukprot:TRINITY_DN402_c0_g1_i1.p1 TRINITY_DN402_c0_g1~~TRINITY_DN402_c0_g1_i1.p1  ORF type:complete len:314 (-),score=77.55 TRINITY_DN402_c0_g1_i1:724-1599(-)
MSNDDTSEKDTTPSAKFRPPDSILDIFAKETDYLRIERWYPDIKDYTYFTTVFPFELDEAKALVQYETLQQLLWFIKEQLGREKDPKFQLSIDSKTMSEINQEVEEKLNEEERNALRRLKTKLEQHVQPLVDKYGGAFVKTSSRSPKDAVFSHPKLYNLIRDGVLEHRHKYPNATPQEIEIADSILFVRSLSYAMKVTSADEAFNLFLNSRRTRNDITSCLLQTGEEAFEMSIIVRAWSNEITPEWEFRAFVFDNEMTSCTQYSKIAYVPRMVGFEMSTRRAFKHWFVVGC